MEAGSFHVQVYSWRTVRARESATSSTTLCSVWLPLISVLLCLGQSDVVLDREPVRRSCWDEFGCLTRHTEMNEDRANDLG